MIPYQYLAIEGNIGAGKTSLCKRLATDLSYKLVLEQFSDNPFLPLFYESPDQHAFAVELFFMAERYQQLQGNLLERELFHKGTIADYFFLKTLLFAGKTLKGDEFRLFKRLFEILNANFPKPELLVYLYRSVPNLLKNIAKRGRPYEAEISPDYLQTIQEAYLDYFKMEHGIPILVLDLGAHDFIEDDRVYGEIRATLTEAYTAGIHLRTIGSVSKGSTGGLQKLLDKY